ncbi:MAG TPA: hypothetical protein VMZ92_03195 [Planctomycetota bacterium]|nr:hypothetical protein [Planctomycetota bacterium]
MADENEGAAQTAVETKPAGGKPQIPDDLKPYFHELREEAKGYRTELKTLRDEVGPLKEQVQKFSEAFTVVTGKKAEPNTDPVKALQDEMAAMKAERETERQAAQEMCANALRDKVAAAIVTKAVQLGLEEDVDPNLVVKLVDASGITIDESGEVQGVGDALAALQKQVPPIFNKGNARTWPGTPGGGTPTTTKPPDDSMAGRIQKLAEKKVRDRGFIPTGAVGRQPDTNAR